MVTPQSSGTLTSRSLLFALLFLFLVPDLPAQQSAHPKLPAQEGIFLVFPFENVAAPATLDWIGEGMEELTTQRLSAAGQQVYSHAGRLSELDRYGLPSSGKLSRASMLRIATDMDADFVIFGRFTSDRTTLTLQARVLRVNPTSLSPWVSEGGPLASMMELNTKLVWRLLSQVAHPYPLSLGEFTKLQRPLRLDAFEHYIRGVLANEDETRVRELKEAARLEPEWPDPTFALGQAYYARNDCGSALTWLSRIPVNDERSAEARFMGGVCRLRLGQPDKAEEAFASLQEGLRHNRLSGGDLPEILNNLALSRARQNNYAAAMADLSKAVSLDPDEDDYPFNLGLLSLKSNDLAAAENHFREATEREPENPEDRAFLIQVLEKSGKKPLAEQERAAAAEAFGDGGLPIVRWDGTGEFLGKYERVKRELDVTSLRIGLETPLQPGSGEVVAATEHAAVATPATLLRRAHHEMVAGKLDDAEKDYQAILGMEPSSAAAHRGLGEINRRRGKLDAAAQQLQMSLAIQDSAAVRTLLARVYLEQKKPDLARAEVEHAVKMAPNYAEAKELLEHLEKAKPTGGTR